MRFSVYLLVCTSLVFLQGCGDEPQPAETPSDARQPRSRAPLQVDALPLPERARFAMQRILRGPERSSRNLHIAKLHPTSLAMAQQDLIDMPGATQALLADPALLERVTGSAIKDTNPWLGVLSVLLAMPQKPVSLVLRWVEPALQRPDERPLLRRALRTLTSLSDPAIGPLVLRFLEQTPSDRIIAPRAFQALAGLGSPWREAALALVLKHGDPYFWKGMPRLAGLAPTRKGPDATQRSALAWTVHLLEASGPRPPAGMPREQKHGFSRARLWTDPAVRRVTRKGRRGGQYRVQAYGLLPLETAYGEGWLSADQATSTFLPTASMYFTGKDPAAEVRCDLATLGHAPFLHARTFEDTEAFQKIDASVYKAAHHCVSPQTDGDRREENLAEFEALLDKAVGSSTPGVDGAPTPAELHRLMGGLPTDQPERIRRNLLRILHELRPLTPWATVINSAHDGLVGAPPLTAESLGYMLTLAFESKPEDRGVALHLMRRARYADYLPLVERMLAERVPAEEGLLWRSLLFLYPTVVGVPPADMLDFVERAAVWIETTLEPRDGARRSAALAVGLLDFGDPGGAAYTRFLRGANRAAYVGVLGSRKSLLPPAVVDALITPMDANTPLPEMRAVLEIAWRLFPSSAAGHLVALEQVASEAAKPMIQAALLRCRHRGPREARGP